MTFKIPNKYLFLIIIIALAGVLSLGWYLGAKNKDRALNATINALNKELSLSELEIRDSKAFIASKEQEIVKQKKALKELGLDKDDLKALNLALTSEIIEAKLRIDTLLENVDHSGGIITIRDTVYKERNAIVLPFSFTKADKYMNLRGNFDNTGKLSVSLETWATVDVISGVSKDGERTTSIISNNPYLKTIDVASFKTDVRKPHKWGIGLIGGYGLSINSKSQLVPFIGVG